MARVQQYPEETPTTDLERRVATLEGLAAGSWNDWTPAYTNVTKGNGTEVARFVRINKLVALHFTLTFGSSTTIDGTNPTVSLPVNASSNYTFPRNTIGDAYLFEDGVNATLGVVRTQTAAIMSVGIMNAAGTNVTPTNMSATAPHTWGINDILYMAALYEAA